MFALIAAACWAAYILLSKRVGASFAHLDGLAIALGVGTLFVAPAGIVAGRLRRCCSPRCWPVAARWRCCPR